MVETMIRMTNMVAKGKQSPEPGAVRTDRPCKKVLRKTAFCLCFACLACMSLLPFQTVRAEGPGQFFARSAPALEQLLLTAEEGQVIRLPESIVITEPTVLSGNGAVLMREDGMTGPLFQVESGGMLTLQDIVLDGRGSAGNTSLIVSAGSLEIGQGCVLRNNDSEDGGAIYSTGRLMINGGIFTGNHADFHGGAIWSGGYLEMNDGSIYGNRAEGNGGGIYCDYGNFMLKGGRVDGNEALCGGYDLYSQYRVLYQPGVVTPSRCYGDLDLYGSGQEQTEAYQDNGFMWFESRPSNTSFVTGGYDTQGHLYGLTYADYGFEVFLQTPEQPMTLIQTGQGEERDVADGLMVSQTLSFTEDGNGVQVCYRVRNSSDSAQVYALGVGADVQAGSDEQTVIYRNQHGFTIEDTRPREPALRPCFQILCQNQTTFPDADACWLGTSEDGTYYHNLFADSADADAREQSDALLSFSWQNRALAPGEEETLGFTIRFTTMGEQWKVYADEMIRQNVEEMKWK